MALSIFKKKGKKTESPKMFLMDANQMTPSAPPPYQAEPGPFDTWGNEELEEAMKVCYLVDTCLSVTTREPIRSVVDAYIIAQGVLDHYTGPILTRPFYIALFLGGIHGMQAGVKGARSILYEREHHGPLVFPYHRSNPLDGTPRAIEFQYTTSLRGKPVEVSFQARLQATRQFGPGVEVYLDGLQRIERPGNELVLKQFRVPLLMLEKGKWVFNLDSEGSYN
uniref:Matrix protein n=1 Tax=Eel virus European X TaxID=685443 RepID=A0A0A7AB95_9RHAB|nr:matrix protein [Eel virus European X]